MAAITRVIPLTSELKDNKTALEYLKKSIEIGDQGPYCNTDENKANTFLNIASVYSSAGKHDVALSFCRNAASLLNEAIKDFEISSGRNMLNEKKTMENLLTALIIAY